MRARPWLLAVVAITACDKGASSPKPPTTAPSPTTGEALSFIPGAIAEKLGDANTVIALDLRRMGVDKLEKFLRPQMPCFADLVGSVGVAVVGESEGYVTRAPEKMVAECVSKIAPMFGGTYENRELVMGSARFAFVWDGDTLHVSKKGVTAPPKLSKAQRERIARTPAAATAWVVSNGYPAYKIKQSVLWLESAPMAWKLVVDAEGTEPGAVGPWVGGIVTGFTAGAESKGVKVDPTWFKQTTTDMTSHLEGSIPTSIFDGLAP